MMIVIAAVLTGVMILTLSKFSGVLGLIDSPGLRKHHKGNVPLVGGLAFFIASNSVLLIVYSHEPIAASYLLAGMLVTMMGAVDDSQNLGVAVRLFVQMLSALLLVLSTGHSIENFFTMFNGNDVEISFLAGSILTIFAVMGAINAFNMVDGIDGLAGLLSLNTFLSLAVLFWLSGQAYWSWWPLLISSCLLMFLCFNLGLIRSFPKVFMGDAGSMFIGLSIIFLLVIGSQSDQPVFRTVTALWIIAVPLTDMAAVIIHRVRQKRSPFTADRQHLHHLLLDQGLSVIKVVILLSFLAVCYSCLAVMSEYYSWPDYFMFYGFLCNFVIHCLIRRHLLNNRV